MKTRLTEATAALVKKFYMHGGLWNRFVYAEEPEEILRQISDAGEPAAIPDLLPILLVGDKKAAEASAEAIRRLIEQVKPRDFVGLDNMVRTGCSNWLPRREPWYSMTTKDVADLTKFGDASLSVLGMASLHGNGHIREAAIRALGKFRTGGELPFLLLRVNDWVEVIRRLARGLVLDRARAEYTNHFLDWLALALRLEMAGRDDHSALIKAIREHFSRDEARKTVEAGFGSDDKLTRRFCFDIAYDADVRFQKEAIKRAFETTDLQVRRGALQRLRELPADEELNKVFVLARNDPYAPLRRQALGIYAERFSHQADAEFRLALLDVSVVVREEARRFFGKKGGFDVREYYIECLRTSSGRKLCAAIEGIAEIGRAADAKLLEPFLDATLPRVRAAALHAAARLNANAYLEQFVSALRDASSRVAREGALGLVRSTNRVGAEKLWEIFLSSRHARSRRLILYLFARINKWDGITCLIQALNDEDRGVVELSQRYIERWFTRYNRSFLRPTAGQVEKLRGALEDYRLLIRSEDQTVLESILKTL